MTPPAHLLLGPPGHGVRLLAEQVAATVGAPTVTTWAEAAAHERLHVHLTDRLVADDLDPLADAARRGRLTVTLHDLPQPTDGTPFTRRRAAYRHLLGLADDWAVSSHHEQALAAEHLAPRRPGVVVPLPVVRDEAVGAGEGAGEGTGEGAGADLPDWPAGPTVAVLGFLYPGKGHAELVAAAGAVAGDLPGDLAGDLAVPLTVLALGAVAPGHEDLVAALTRQAEDVGVGFRTTGHLSDQAMAAACRRVDVPVCGHRNVSASGSTNTWVAAGRRPLVRRSRYAEEMETLRPRCHRLYDDPTLPAELAAALADPARTRLDAATDTRPHLADVARAYLAWWDAA